MKMVEAVLPGDSRSSPLEHARSVLVDAQQEIASTFRTNTDQLSRATLPVASLLLEASDSMLEEEKSRSLHAHIDTLVAYELVAQELWARTVKTGPKSLEQTTSMVHEQLEHLQRSFPYTAEAVFESATVTAEELLDRRLFPSRAGLKNSGPSPALEGAGLSAYEKYMYSQKFVATAVATHKERLIRLGEERPDLVHTIDKLIGNIANSALDSSDSHCGKRFNKLIQAVHSVGLATRGSNGLVPRAFEVATVGNRSIDFNNFRNQLSRNALPDQVDAMVLAMGKFGEEWLGGREYHAVENVIRLERTLGEKKNLDEHIPQWELAFSGLFKSNPYDQEFFKTLNDRDRATLIVLAMQNGLGMQAKVQRLLQMPEATRLLAELATTKAADRFAGWGEAARVATLVYNESIRTTDQHISLAKKLAVQAAKVFYPHASREPGADDGSPRPPRKPDWGYIGIAGTVLVSIACGVIAKVVDNSATLPAPGVSTYEPTIGPTPIASISPDAMTARASATPKVDTMIGPAPSMVMSAFRYAPINNGEFGIPPTTQQWLNVIAGGATDSTIQSSLQATTLWADARAHCKDASTCMVAAASYTEPGNPNASRTAYFLRAPDGFILAASTNPDGSINVENSRWLPPLVARDGTPLVPYEVFNYGARTDACQIYPAPPADQRRVVWASPDGRVVAHQTLFGNGLAEFVVINHSILFGDNNAFRDVCGKAFAARALNDGRLVGAFYPVGADGNVIFANPTNADSKINTYAIFDPKSGEWLWKDGPLPTPTPEATATMAPIPVVSEFITGVKPVKSYDFNQNANGVSYPSASVFWMRNGTMQIEGLQTWGSNLRFDTAIQAGQAVVLDFKSGDTSVVFIDVGNFGDPAYRRVGFNVKGGKLLDDTFRGKTYDMSPLSGTLGTIKPDTWYKAMFAVGPDGTVRMVIWDPTDSTKRVVHDVANPDIAGKSMNLTLGAYSGALIIDQADVLKFESLLIKLPETPVAVQPTLRPTQPATAVAQPTPGEQPPVVNPPPVEKPTSGFGDKPEGDRWICRCSWTDPNTLTNNANVTIGINVWDYSVSPAKLVDSKSYTRDQITSFNTLVNNYSTLGYSKVNTIIYQSTYLGSPYDTYRPDLVIYTMNNK